jgi:predicted dehydrogenase
MRRASGIVARVMFGQTRVFGDFHQMLAEAKPDAVFIGVPPAAHAAVAAPYDLELACAAAGVHMFIEKPLAAATPEQLGPVVEKMAQAARQGLVVSVGYMFRYSKAIDKMRQLIAEVPGGLRALVARYHSAYSQIAKRQWWDIRQTGGPIVEQATHFCDLTRLLGGEVDLASVQAVAIDPTSHKAALCDVPHDEAGAPLDQGVPIEYHVPRSTAAVWRFASGAIGSLSHATLLHQAKYESELEVWGDGLRLVLQDPYGACRLLARRPYSERTEVIGEYLDDDSYLTEDAAFLAAIRTGDASGIRSTYADAFRTHQFAWAIRRAAERNARPEA